VNHLTSVSYWTSSYGPGISWAIFDAGRIRQNIEVQTELQEQALFHYESVILGAIEEVENSLTAFVNEQEKRTSLKKAVEAAETAVGLSEQKYKAGLVDFSNVLDAQRSLLAFENQLTESRGAIAAQLIRLYKSLGGGWSSI
jgi:outer membrane protein TolC